jgi:polyisoprenyl-phosphate glycosyltransferase
MAPSANGGVSTVGALPFPLVERTGRAQLCVVVPAYNESHGLMELHAHLAATLETLDVSWSLLIVNDGSSDDTVQVLELLAAADERVSYVCLSRRFGHQAALAAGLDAATGDVVITMDADLQHPPETLPALIGGWRDGYDVVHTTKVGTEDLPWARSLVTRLAYRAIRHVADVEMIPQASDFRLLDRAAVSVLRALPERQRLLRGLTPWIGFRQAVIPYRAHARANGDSRYGVRQLLQLFARSFFDFSNAPLHVGLILGGFAIFASAAYLLYTVLVYALGHGVPHGYVTLVFVIVFLSAINLTFTGILGVYLARVYNEVRGRPTYVVGSAVRQQELGIAVPPREEEGELSDGLHVMQHVGRR